MNKNILIKMTRSVAILAAFVPFTSFAVDYTPAKFGNAESVLRNQVTLPATFGEGVKTVAVYCQVDVMTTGNVNNVACYENSPLVSMKNLTESALKSATFEAAKIDDEAVPVRMQMRVVYSVAGSQAPIVLLPNLGTLQAQYGTHYYAPQERLDKNNWYVGYSAKAHTDGKLFFAEGKLTRIIANVEATGGVESVSTLESANRRAADAARIEAGLKKTNFIPGFVENQPKAMHYIAVVNYQ